MKTKLIIAAMLAAAGLAGAQMFAQLFGGSVGTPIPAVAWYKLDGSAVDSIAANNGTINGATTTNALTGVALSFNGINDYVSIPHSSANAGWSVRTFTFWARRKAFTTINAGLIAKYATLSNKRGYTITDSSTADGSSLSVSMSSNGVEFVRQDTDTGFWENGAATHVGVSFDSGIVKIYKNGTLFDTLDFGGQTAFNNTLIPMEIGGYTQSSRFFAGEIDDVRIYSRALSEANIARIMESQYNEPLEELQ